jgi:Flp pilus assembly protein TadG
VTRGLGRESGSALVEMAIVVPLFLLLVFGVIEFGFVFYRQIGINQGVREAARSAAVANYSGGVATCTGTSVVEIACLADARSGVSGTKSAVHIVGPGTGVGAEVEVCSEYPESSVTGLFSSLLPAHLTSNVTMRLEQPLTGGADYSEAGFFGSCS